MSCIDVDGFDDKIMICSHFALTNNFKNLNVVEDAKLVLNVMKAF